VIYDPWWLQKLPPKDRDAVQNWLTSHGVDINRCRDFQLEKVNGSTVTYKANMYKLGEDGNPMWHTLEAEAIMDTPIEVTENVGKLPKALQPGYSPETPPN
jgi:hypothetical protein